MFSLPSQISDSTANAAHEAMLWCVRIAEWQGNKFMDANELAERDQRYNHSGLKGPKNSLNAENWREKEIKMKTVRRVRKGKSWWKRRKATLKSMEKTVFKNKKVWGARPELHVVLWCAITRATIPRTLTMIEYRGIRWNFSSPLKQRFPRVSPDRFVSIVIIGYCCLNRGIQANMTGAHKGGIWLSSCQISQH